jgi:hypothetical protein
LQSGTIWPTPGAGGGGGGGNAGGADTGGGGGGGGGVMAVSARSILFENTNDLQTKGGHGGNGAGAGPGYGGGGGGGGWIELVYGFDQEDFVSTFTAANNATGGLVGTGGGGPTAGTNGYVIAIHIGIG